MAEYWAARIGRKGGMNQVPPAITLVLASSYYMYHTYLKDFIKEFYGYHVDGERDTISDELKKLVAHVYFEAREKQRLTREYLETPMSKPSSFTWFASSTMEPINLGMSELKTGVTIGLPYFYNYESHDDIPDHVLEMKKLKLFRSPFKRSKGEKKMKEEDQELVDSIIGCNTDGKPVYEILGKFDRDSEKGKEYMDTLILSPEAKRFSIARELFVSDSYRVLLNCGAITASGLAAIFTAHYSVKYFKVLKSSLAIRIPYYILSAIYGYGLFTLSFNEINKTTYIRARDKAQAMGSDYVKGADEYFAKCKRRRELLFALLTDEKDY